MCQVFSCLTVCAIVTMVVTLGSGSSANTGAVCGVVGSKTNVLSHLTSCNGTTPSPPAPLPQGGEGGS
jgi:hypothetical protein